MVSAQTASHGQMTSNVTRKGLKTVSDAVHALLEMWHRHSCSDSTGKTDSHGLPCSFPQAPSKTQQWLSSQVALCICELSGRYSSAEADIPAAAAISAMLSPATRPPSVLG